MSAILSYLSKGESLKQAAEDGLMEFVRQGWHVLEPSNPLIENWHMGVICAHLEAVHHGEITRIIFNIPPRHSKSIIVNVFFPAWVWIHKPAERFFTASYAKSLALRDATNARDLMQSKWYQDRWGDRFSFDINRSAKSHYYNDHKGYRYSTSVGSAATGFGGLRVVDDFLPADAAYSGKKLEAAIRWLEDTLSSRYEGQQRAEIYVMQRISAKDPIGHLIASKDYASEEAKYIHVCIPTEYEGRKDFSTPPDLFDPARPNNTRATPLSWRDPRTKEGELLFPGMFPPELIASEKTNSNRFATQHQQRPGAKEGVMFKLRWLRGFDLRHPPVFKRVILSWDTASKQNSSSDYSVGTTWGETKNNDYYLLDVFRDKVELPELIDHMILQWEKAKQWSQRGNPNAMLIEDKSSGTQAAQTIRKLSMEEKRAKVLRLRDEYGVKLDRFPNLIVIDIKVSPSMSKEMRADGVTPLFESGRVFVPNEAPWRATYVQELTQFPNAQYDDSVDSSSQVLDWFAGKASKGGKKDWEKLGG